MVRWRRCCPRQAAHAGLGPEPVADRALTERVIRGAEGREQFPFAPSSPKLPLEGLRVLDAGNMVAAPFATVLLADFGADVIKLEHPKFGDGERKLAPINPEGVPLWWKNGARNKRCVTLDLSKPQGQSIFKELAAHADVV